MRERARNGERAGAGEWITKPIVPHKRVDCPMGCREHQGFWLDGATVLGTICSTCDLHTVSDFWGDHLGDMAKRLP